MKIKHLNPDNISDRKRVHPKYPGFDEDGNIPNGEYVVMRDNGRIHTIINYRNGYVHGPFCDFWPDGSVACQGAFSDGLQSGIWTFFHEPGIKHETIYFHQGKEIKSIRHELKSEE